MKKVKGLFSMALIGTMLSISQGNVWADPVEPRGIVDLRQPTQQLFKAEVQGDEWLSYAIVENTKELVVFGENNYWYYATIEANTNHLVATDSKFSIDAKPDNAAYEKDISKIKVDIPEVNVVEPKTKSRNVQQKRNLLVVMIEFNDTPMAFTKNDWHNTIFASGKDSANDFYQEATKGLIQFTPVKNTQENTVDGVVKVKLDKNHPNTGFASDKFTLPRQMINEALNQENQTLNLKQYDTNKDGYLSPDELHVLAVFSGYSASATNASTGVSPTIHPHRWGGGISVDGVKVGTYTAVTDKRKWYLTDPDAQSTIGTVVHELGHDLGLPDLYNPSNTQGNGLGSYSIMANSHTTMNGKTPGSYPVHFDAYSKVKLGLIEPTIITNEQTLTINEIQQSNFNVAKVETEDPKQYYLIENRQMKGFDAALAPYIHSGGVGIYYVNEHIPKNEGAGKQIVTLREADQGVVGYSKLDSNMLRGLDGFYYKGIGMHNKEQTIELGRKTVPASTLPDGKNPKFDIIVNDESKDSMSVTFSNPKISVIDITLNPAKLSLDVGKIEQLTATITPDNATNKTVTWRSSDEKIATVDQKGLVTAQASGTATITAETEDGKQTASSTVEVTSARGTYGTTPWTWDEPTQTLTFKKGDFPATHSTHNIEKLIQRDRLKEKKIKKIKFEDTVSLNKDSGYLFANLRQLEEIEGIEKLNTSAVTNMSYMFSATKIASLDLNTWDTS
ncbi:M6 family metalloprotease domain-containing protein, partial [Candidatus Enterococcus ikei]